MDIEIQQVLTQIAGFLILLWLMKRYAWRPILGLLDERRQRISAEFDEITRLKEEFTRQEKEYAAKWAALEAETRERLLGAVQEGQGLAREIQDKAREDARKNMERIRESLQLEVTQARLELRREMVDLAIMAAERILKEHLDEARHREVVTRFLDELEQVR